MLYKTDNTCLSLTIHEISLFRCQGACVASVKAEYLMEPRDYHLWKQIQAEFRLELERNGDFEEASKLTLEEELDDDVFEAVSKRAWTDILLQILKVITVNHASRCV